MRSPFTKSNFFTSRRSSWLSATLTGMVLGLFLWAAGCATSSSEKVNPLAGDPPAGRVSIMAYNVENFFDELHDSNHEDYTFLPLSFKHSSKEAMSYCAKQSGYRQIECRELNWDNAAVEKKIRHVSDGILQVYGRGPDMLILVEIENLRVLKRLRDEGLKNSGYQTAVLIDGFDKRGINVGFLSRFPLAGEPKLHEVIYSPSKDPSRVRYPTRGILQVPVKLPSGKTLYVFGLHFPSQANPVEERMDAMNTLTKAIKALPPGSAWVVGGDWNITERENEETGIFDKNIGAMGMVSHKVGCKSCKGTHNYRGVWDFLDILVFSSNLSTVEATGYALIPESIWTPRAGTLQLQNNGRPARFDLKSDIGISDHLPIYGELAAPAAAGAAK